MKEILCFNIGVTVFVDDEDADLVIKYTWSFNGSGKTKYLQTRRPHLQLHKLIAARMGLSGTIDHEDRNTLNNCRSNLRPATIAQNGCNRGVQSNNTSGFKGVSFYAPRNKWRASICVKSKKKHLGFFSTALEAAMAYNEAAIKYHGEFAVLN